MEGQTPSQPITPKPSGGGAVTLSIRSLTIGAIAVLIVVGAVLGWYFGIHSSNSTTTPPKHPAKSGSTGKQSSTTPAVSSKPMSIHFTYPTDWKQVPLKSVKGVPADATSVLQRTDKKALFVVIPSGKPPALDNATVKSIGKSLAKKYTDYKLLSAKLVTLKAGKALLFTYLRTKQGVLHTITIIPAGTRSFIVETASPPQSGAIGKEIAVILKSAKLTHG